LVNGENVGDRAGCGWKTMRLALDIFHLKYNDCEGLSLELRGQN
jgi:hypothetical protein